MYAFARWAHSGKEKEKKEDDILNETPQELVDRVEKFLYNLKNSTTKNKKN